MKPIVRVPLFAALAAALLAGCERAPKREDVEAAAQTTAEVADPAPPVTGREAPQFQFSDDDIGIALAPTPGFALRRESDDAPSEGGWNGLAGPGVRGQPLLRLVLEGSGPGIAAELHIGTSTDSHAMVTCLQPSEASIVGTSDEIRIDGQLFRHFHVVDAGTGHYAPRTMDAYRSVRNERCIAIDLVVFPSLANNPAAVPPFDEATARARLQEALAAVRITR